MTEKMIFYGALGCSILLPLVALARELRPQRAAELTLSHFWYFTLIYVVAFPVRAWLLNIGQIETQVLYKGTVDSPFNSHALPLTDAIMATSLLISMAFWTSVYAGYRIAGRAPTNSTQILSFETTPFALKSNTIWHVALLVVAIAVTVYLDPVSLFSKPPDSYFLAQKGRGALWFLPGFFLYSAAIIAATYLKSGTSRIPPWFWCALVTTVGVAMFVSYSLSTRRILAAVALFFVVSAVLRARRLWPLGLVAVRATIFASSVLDFFRNVRGSFERGMPFKEALVWTYENVFGDKLLHLISTSFEGVEHVAQLIGKATWDQLLTGIDSGISWFFNVGGAYIPRAIWPTKPLFYGGIEQFHWLYPGFFEGGFNTTSIPTSFVVDFSFAFGIPIGLVVAFFVGRFFRVCQNSFWAPGTTTVSLAVSLYTFVFMFNIVRGGSVHVQGLVILCLLCVLLCGWQQTVTTVLAIIRSVFLHPISGVSVPTTMKSNSLEP